jgi:hypothetical protein
VLLETSSLKEGARVAVGEWSLQLGKPPTRGNTEPGEKKTLKAQHSEKIER